MKSFLKSGDKVGKKNEVSSIRESIAKANEELGVLNKSLAILSRREEGIKFEKDSIKNAINKLEWSIAEKKELLVVKQGIASDLVKQRKEIARLVKWSQSSDIKVGEQKSVLAEIENRLKVLRDSCPHQFLYSHDGSRGSRGYDFEDAYPGRNICAVCGFSEASTGWEGGEGFLELPHEVYKILKMGEDRLVKRDLRKKMTKFPDVIESLDEIINNFESSAGNMNLTIEDKEVTSV